MENKRKPIDVIIMIVLATLVIAMAVFTVTRETANQEIILMEIYKSAGPDTSTSSPNHYYIYQNTNVIGIRSSNFNNTSGKSTNNLTKKEINQDLIDNLKNSLEEYIRKNPSMNSNLYINERYTIEYDARTIIVPNPGIVINFDLEPEQYSFYYTVDTFINNIKN